MPSLENWDGGWGKGALKQKSRPSLTVIRVITQIIAHVCGKHNVQALITF